MASFSLTGYVRSVVEEGKKVIWPTRELIIRHSLMVVATIVIATILVGALDLGLQELVVRAINRAQ